MINSKTLWLNVAVKISKIWDNHEGFNTKTTDYSIFFAN